MVQAFEPLSDEKIDYRTPTQSFKIIEGGVLARPFEVACVEKTTFVFLQGSHLLGMYDFVYCLSLHRIYILCMLTQNKQS